MSAAGSFGQVTVSWSSDEPATSTIWYGTNPVLSSLTSELSNPDLTTTHSIDFGRLVPGKTYYYFVASADEAGNISTNNNAGAFFTFVAPNTATVLLVDEYQDELFGVPPISGYTDPLNQIGVSYDLWEEKFSVARVGRVRRSASHLSASAAQTWCLDNLTLSTAGLPPNRPFWLRLEVRADDTQGGLGVLDEPGINLTRLVEIFSRWAPKGIPNLNIGTLMKVYR